MEDGILSNPHCPYLHPVDADDISHRGDEWQLPLVTSEYANVHVAVVRGEVGKDERADEVCGMDGKREDDVDERQGISRMQRSHHEKFVGHWTGRQY